jgi:hypothetical protein
MVYDATKCGLNKVVWAPNVFMSSPNLLYNALDADTWMGDIDVGEFFLNFFLNQEICPYAGVDLSPYLARMLAPIRVL